MTRDEIIKLAREAGIVAIHAEGATNWAEEVDALERFAALVAAAEREACAELCEALNSESDYIYGDECAAPIRARNKE